MDETVTCLVRGPASRYQRGYMWLYPVWFAILAAAVLVVSERASGRLPLWLGASEIGGLLLAGCTAVAVLLTARRVAFRADGQGILLGSRGARKRPSLRQAYLPWTDVADVRLVPRRYGVLAEIVLVPAAPLGPAPAPGLQALRLLGTLIMPFVAGLGRPALTVPRAWPPRYRVRICETTAGELRLALHEVKPETVPVRLVNSMAALRLIGWRSRHLGTLRPAWRASQLKSPPTGRPPTAADGP